MVTIPSLILPILLSAGLVWVAAALIWTVLPWHKKDFSALPDEAGAVAALRERNLAPGEYMFPHAVSPDAMKDPTVLKTYEDGPAGFVTVRPRGVPNMGRNMALIAVFYLGVGIVVAYAASRTLPPGADYMTVFRLTATVAWLAHGAGSVPEAIWFGRPWSRIFKEWGDALILALLTGGAFAWLWPDAG